MRFFITLILGILFSTIAQSQNNKINADNYFEFHTSMKNTNWLKRNEVVPIIIEELEKYNFKWNFEYVLYDLNDSIEILMDAYSTENNFGFIYKTGHYAIPDIEHKNDMRYSQIKYNKKGSLVRTKIDLPENVYILNENGYWFQYNNDKNEINDFVCRPKIIEILRTDIRNILKQYTDLDNALEEKKWIEIRPDFESMRKRFENADGIQGFNSQAKFYNGTEGLNKYINESINYPKDARRKKIEGSVIVEYTVNTKGEIENPIVLESNNEIFNDEAIRVILNMPKWRPALNSKNEEISMLYRQMITFSPKK